MSKPCLGGNHPLTTSIAPGAATKSKALPTDRSMTVSYEESSIKARVLTVPNRMTVWYKYTKDPYTRKRTRALTFKHNKNSAHNRISLAAQQTERCRDGNTKQTQSFSNTGLPVAVMKHRDYAGLSELRSASTQNRKDRTDYRDCRFLGAEEQNTRVQAGRHRRKVALANERMMPLPTARTPCHLSAAWQKTMFSKDARCARFFSPIGPQFKVASIEECRVSQTYRISVFSPVVAQDLSFNEPPTCKKFSAPRKMWQERAFKQIHSLTCGY